jgi:hypothetical protein
VASLAISIAGSSTTIGCKGRGATDVCPPWPLPASDGAFVLVHADYQVVGPLTTADLLVTSLTPDRQQACVDTPLPVSHDGAPLVTFLADTLCVLDRQVLSDAAVETRITAYGVDTSRCRPVRLRQSR